MADKQWPFTIAANVFICLHSNIQYMYKTYIYALTSTFVNLCRVLLLLNTHIDITVHL